MATYESYKDSSVKWLGQIPSHWEVKKLRAFFSEVCDNNSALKVRNQLQFKYGTIVPKPDSGIDETVLKTISKYTVVYPGDIIINGLNLNYDFISFRVGKVNESGVITSAYIAMRPNSGLSPKFYEYMLKAMDAKKVFHGFGTGIRSTLSFKELKHKLLPMVPLVEQEAIVAYLDKVTAEIDRAIEAQQKMIEALNERKQIIITRAVTRGLNPDAPLRDSGIDWLGQIPAHWEKTKVKAIATISHGCDPRTEGDTPVYGSGATSFKLCGEFKIGPVVLLGRKGATLHIPHYIEGKYWNVDTAFDVRVNSSFNLRYFYYLATSFDYPRYRTQTTLPSMTQSTYGNIQIPYPNLQEQHKIVEYLDNECKKLNSAIQTCERMISLLQERKQIIINEVVTGKKKVI